MSRFASFRSELHIVPRRFATFTIGRRATPQETEAVAVAELKATPAEVLEAMATDAR